MDDLISRQAAIDALQGRKRGKGMTDRKPDIPDINKIKCEDCRYSVDNVNEERPKMRFCAISGHALDIMDKGLPIWGCPIKDAYMQKREEKENEIHRLYQKYVR